MLRFYILALSNKFAILATATVDIYIYISFIQDFTPALRLTDNFLFVDDAILLVSADANCDDLVKR